MDKLPEDGLSPEGKKRRQFLGGATAVGVAGVVDAVLGDAGAQSIPTFWETLPPGTVEITREKLVHIFGASAMEMAGTGSIDVSFIISSAAETNPALSAFRNNRQLIESLFLWHRRQTTRDDQMILIERGEEGKPEYSAVRPETPRISSPRSVRAVHVNVPALQRFLAEQRPGRR